MLSLLADSGAVGLPLPYRSTSSAAAAAARKTGHYLTPGKKFTKSEEVDEKSEGSREKNPKSKVGKPLGKGPRKSAEAADFIETNSKLEKKGRKVGKQKFSLDDGAPMASAGIDRRSMQDEGLMSAQGMAVGGQNSDQPSLRIDLTQNIDVTPLVYNIWESGHNTDSKLSSIDDAEDKTREDEKSFKCSKDILSLMVESESVSASSSSQTIDTYYSGNIDQESQSIVVGSIDRVNIDLDQSGETIWYSLHDSDHDSDGTISKQNLEDAEN